MRISGVTIPDQKHLEVGLTEVFGVGRKTAREVLTKAGIPFNKRAKDTSETEELAIRKALEGINVEGDLRQKVSNDIRRLKDTGSLRGTRHTLGLPVRGQRTKTNARTKRGKRRTMGSGKVKLQKK